MEKMAVPEGKYLASVRVGPKGQIVIPKEARELFGIQPGDTLLLLADVNRGIALQTFEKADPIPSRPLRRPTPSLPRRLPGERGRGKKPEAAPEGAAFLA